MKKFNKDELFVVLVLYNTKLEDSETYKTIVSNNKKIRLRGVVFDNSNKKQDIRGIDKLGDFHYIHDKSNPGLAVAYNYALKLALKSNCKWLLLLDQDTYFTSNYFNNLMFDDNKEIVVYIPTVKSYRDKASYISPSVLQMGGFKAFSEDTKGIQSNKVSGINSGTIISCAFIKSVGGFNEEYPLDMLDHWYFREIYRNNKYVSVLNSEIFQNLSVQDNFEKHISLSRYANFIEVENRFFKTGETSQYFFYRLRLILRLLKQIKFRNKKYFKITLKKIVDFG